MPVVALLLVCWSALAVAQPSAPVLVSRKAARSGLPTRIISSVAWPKLML